jgi:hypothetical protein
LAADNGADPFPLLGSLVRLPFRITLAGGFRWTVPKGILNP